jgi:hypothetical protein
MSGQKKRRPAVKTEDLASEQERKKRRIGEDHLEVEAGDAGLGAAPMDMSEDGEEQANPFLAAAEVELAGAALPPMPLAAPDAAPPVAPAAGDAMALLVDLAARVQADADRENLRVVEDPAVDLLACWNFALHGGVDGPADPAPLFKSQATAEDSPYVNQTPAGAPAEFAEFGLPPKRGAARAQQAQQEVGWHNRVVRSVIEGSGWRIDDGSDLKIIYQYVPGTAMYHHWELWFDDGAAFVAVAKFTGVPVHAKDTETNLAAEGLAQMEIGVDPASIKELHLDRIRALRQDGGPRKGGIYPS